MTSVSRLKAILALTFLLRFAFLGVHGDRDSPLYSPFLLSNLEFTIQELIFHTFESLWDAVFAYVMMVEVTRYKFLAGFFYFFLGRLIEWVLTGNDIWYMWGHFPVSWNTVGALWVIGALILYNRER